MRESNLLRQKADVGVYLCTSVSSEYYSHVTLIRQKLEVPAGDIGPLTGCFILSAAGSGCPAPRCIDS